MSRLLQLPPEIRNRIYRLVLTPIKQVKWVGGEKFTWIDDWHYIRVGYEGYPIPPLLLACKQLRAETTNIFYFENAFSVQVLDYDIQLYHSYRKHLGRLGLKGKETCDKMKVSLSHVSHAPNWSNLLQWLELHHARQVGGVLGFGSPDTSEGRINVDMSRRGWRDETALGALFAVVEDLRRLPWSRVRKTVMKMRTMLAYADDRWAL